MSQINQEHIHTTFIPLSIINNTNHKVIRMHKTNKHRLEAKVHSSQRETENNCDNSLKKVEKCFHSGTESVFSFILFHHRCLLPTKVNFLWFSILSQLRRRICMSITQEPAHWLYLFWPEKHSDAKRWTS